VPEHLSLDLALDLVGLEGTDDEVVGVVGAAGHLVLLNSDHGVEGAGTADLGKHVVELTLRHELADVVESATDVVLGDGAILVNVHQLEALLVHPDNVGKLMSEGELDDMLAEVGGACTFDAMIIV
jgi:hypothetical protein